MSEKKSIEMLTPYQRAKIIGVLKYLGIYKLEDRKSTDEQLHEKLQKINAHTPLTTDKRNCLANLIKPKTSLGLSDAELITEVKVIA
jgi:hypothetical protein